MSECVSDVCWTVISMCVCPVENVSETSPQLVSLCDLYVQCAVKLCE